MGICYEYDVAGLTQETQALYVSPVLINIECTCFCVITFLLFFGGFSRSCFENMTKYTVCKLNSKIFRTDNKYVGHAPYLVRRGEYL